MISRVTISLLLLLTAGCKDRAPESLVGKYTAVSESYQYFLELKPNRAYSRRIIDPNGQEYTNVGRWESDYPRSKHELRIKGFKSFLFGRQ